MDSAAADLVIGMLFIFLVFGVLVSGINEGITRLIAWRSRHLWKALRRILDGEVPALRTDRRPLANDEPQPERWTDRIYAHHLIQQLEGRTPTRRSRLSHIPADDFSRALIDVLVPNSDGETSVDNVRTALRSLPEDSPFRAPLLTLTAEAEGQLAQLRKGISDWFDGRMDALSRAYKLHAKWVLVAVGIVVAIAFNVDAFHVATQLYRDDALRSAISQQARSAVDGCETEIDPAECARDRVGVIDPALQLPVGWSDSVGWDPSRVAGWLVAGIALGQGAPFWFDLLRRVSKVRS